MEYVTARTPETDREVRLPAEYEEALESVDVLLKPALAHHDRALEALRARRIPEALSHVEEALQLAPYDPRLVRAATLMALQHDDHDLACRAISQLERFELSDAASFRNELDRRRRQWNARVERPEMLREKYAAADPDVSYRELLLLRDHFEDRLTPRECEHLHRWHLPSASSSNPLQRSQQQDVSRSVLTGVLATGLGWLLHALWGRR